MKSLLLIFISFGAILAVSAQSCDTAKFTDFINAFNNRDYKLIDNLLVDTFSYSARGEKLIDSKEQYIDYVKWSDVFDGHLNHDSIRVEKNHLESNVVMFSERMRFFYGEKVTVLFKLFCDHATGKIYALELNLMGYDESRVNKFWKEFFTWVKDNHPKYLYTIYQMNKKGAKVLKKAIRKYKKAHN